MKKFSALFQIVVAILAGLIAAATAINLILISMRPETISVVNTMVGQGVLIVVLAALATSLLRKGLQGWRALDSERASD